MGDPAPPLPPPVAVRPATKRLLHRGAITEGLLGQADDATPMSVIIELNLRHARGLPGASDRFATLYKQITGTDVAAWQVIAGIYRHCVLTKAQIEELVSLDSTGDAASPNTKADRSIYRVWKDFDVHPLIDASTVTIKADAARRSFAAVGDTITWAVMDSGIDAAHLHFKTYGTLEGDVAELHRDFSRLDAPGIGGALVDELGHGTHVAGIIAGGLPDKLDDGTQLHIGQQDSDPSGTSQYTVRTLSRGAQLAGVAPLCKLVSLKVLDGQGSSRTSDLLRALAYIREDLNGNGKLLRVHGVNLSVGYDFDPGWFACGQSPLCAEVDRLVRSGVVVVVAAGNTGYGWLTADERQTHTGLAVTINDPGNAELAITVGSTHRNMPHTYGVSYFSSKGPTGDGRMKPDLVAPGEHITSCAAGKNLTALWGGACPAGAVSYLDESGTSMAAPHVSGAIAAFLSVRGEYLGRPEEVKRIFLESATSLGRERTFEGHGLVDLMRALQAI